MNLKVAGGESSGSGTSSLFQRVSAGLQAALHAPSRSDVYGLAPMNFTISTSKTKEKKGQCYIKAKAAALQSELDSAAKSEGETR